MPAGGRQPDIAGQHRPAAGPANRGASDDLDCGLRRLSQIGVALDEYRPEGREHAEDVIDHKGLPELVMERPFH